MKFLMSLIAMNMMTREEEWKPIPIFAYKRLDGMDGRIRLLKRGPDKKTQIPYALMPYLFHMARIQRPYLDQNSELSPV